MEVEITTYTAPPAPKKLHYHFMPIAIIAIAIAVISTPYALQQSMPKGGGAALMHDLSTRPLKVTPSSKGFARVSLNSNNAANYISPEVSRAGSTSVLLFNLDSSQP
jgi:hypothetical protein